jgi:holo-[acyl-carrier protein] synthase
VTISAVTTGVDLVDCARIARLMGEDPSFLSLIFTAVEQEYCQGDPARLGVRWAAKESAMKALGQGIGKIAPLDIEVSRDMNGAPTMELAGSAMARARELGITDWSVSLSHESGFAMAFVVMMKGGRDV